IVNYLNPATYSRLTVTTFDLGFELDTRALREPNISGKYNSGSANVSYVMLGIPVIRDKSGTTRLGATLGLRPNTRISYKIQTNERIENVDSVSSLYEGNGGSYEFIAGAGIRLGNLSIGFNAGYLFGTKDYTSKRIFHNDSVPYYKSNHQTKSTFGGFSLNGGAQYSLRLSRDTWLRLGATGRVERTYKANRDASVATFQYDINGAVFRIDSVYEENNAKGELVYPSSYSFGFMIDKVARWAFGSEFKIANWSDYRFFGQSETLRNAWTINVGGHWSPDILNGKNYWSRVTYRVGAFYGKDYLKIDNDVPVLGITAGAAFPIRRSAYTNQFTVVNTSFELGRRGNTNNAITENFFRFALGISLSDKWFVKKKYF
ncbi:MAG TPA: hypothetical protein VEV87_02070, partial [Chitinophagaceae bacterium]|nr:hypothetical protein [Chitinophagaceae bacterium]